MNNNTTNEIAVALVLTGVLSVALLASGVKGIIKNRKNKNLMKKEKETNIVDIERIQ